MEVNMSSKKSIAKKPDAPLPEQAPILEEPQPEESTTPEPPPIQETPSEPVTSPPEPDNPVTPAPPPPITIESLHDDIEALKIIVAELQDALARKRKPVASTGRVQICDKTTGEIYPSKNNAYQSLLKAGDLKALVAKGVFGDDPPKNTFGWYALVRELPERFEEIQPVEKVA